MVDVEQGALGAFEKDGTSRGARFGQKQRNIGDPGLHPLAVGEHLIEQGPPVELSIP